jgi:hypothetical protein
VADESSWKNINEVAAQFTDDGNGKGFQRAAVLHGSTFKDCSTIIIVPSREEMFHHRVIGAWQNLIAPMNQKRAFLFVVGDEVGAAYTNTIQGILANPEMSKWKYVMTMESDNLPPPDAQIRLIETIEEGQFDGVSGIYFTKGDVNMPMAYGDPNKFRQTGALEFEPRDVREALAKGQVMEVNGIAMGCSLYRLSLFKEVKPPWFVTLNDYVEGQGASAMTQDLYFCRQAKLQGKSFAVDFRVRVGHMDLGTGEVY